MAERLHRSRDDRMLAGVAAGVAETLDADPSIVRILWALLAIVTGGVALVVYIVMAIVVPEEPADLETAGGRPGASAAAPSAEPASPTDSAPSTRSAERAARRAARRARRRESIDSGRAAPIAGVVLIVIGGFFLLRQLLPWLGFHLWWPIALVTLGILLIVFAVRPNRPTE
jgi:phage shock protein PspC (stress-responsive transcriptional regulator)